MKKINYIFFISFLLLLIISCKTAVLNEDYQLYPNKEINDSIKPDSLYIKIISPYKQQLDSIMSQPLSYANIDFTKEGFSSNEGNLLADLVLDFSKKYTKENKLPMPDFCLLNIGGIRTIIPQGVITVGNIYEVAPFENELVFIQLDETQMSEMFEYLRKEKLGHPLAGINVVYKKDKFFSAEIEGVPYNKNKKYWVVTLDYLLTGGDRMYFFTKSDQVTLPHIKLREVLLEQIKKYKILPESKDQRLIFQE